MSSSQVAIIRKQQRNKDYEEEEEYNAADFYSNFYHDEQEDEETPPNIGFGLAPTAEEVNVITSNQKFSLKNLFKYRIKKSGSYIKYLVKKFFKFLVSARVGTLVLLALVGFCTSAIALTMDFIVSNLNWCRYYFSSRTDIYAVNMLIYVLYGLFWALISTTIVHISPNAQGNGIPEMRSILSGIKMSKFLSFKTLCVKVISLTFALAAGFSIGREGPFVHIGPCVAAFLMKFPTFKRINTNDYIKNQILSAAAATGMASIWGAPFGGVLLSLEVTSTYYPIQNFWKAIYCSLVGTVLFYVVRRAGVVGDNSETGLLIQTNFTGTEFTNIEYLLFVVLGIICGVFGALYVVFNTAISRIRSRIKVRWVNYISVTVVAVTTGIVSFALSPIMKYGDINAFHLLFNKDSLLFDNVIHDVYLTLVLYVVAKYVFTILANNIFIPSGVFMPSILIGAGLGRLFGQLLNLGLVVSPAVYAAVGAAAFSTGVTRKLSTAVIVFEITGQLSLMIPIIIACLVSTFVGSIFNTDVYDSLLSIKQLPYLKMIKYSQSYKKIVLDFVRVDVKYLTLQDTIKDVSGLLGKSRYNMFPLVKSEENKTLIGIVMRKDLENLGKKREEDDTKVDRSHQKVNFMPKIITKEELHQTNIFIKSSEEDQAKLLKIVKESKILVEDATIQPIPESLAKTLQELEKKSSPIASAEVELKPISSEVSRESLSHEDGLLEEGTHLATAMETAEDRTGRFNVPVIPISFMVDIFTPISQVHVLFLMLGLTHVYVVNQGKLCGVLTKKDLIAANL